MRQTNPKTLRQIIKSKNWIVLYFSTKIVSCTIEMQTIWLTLKIKIQKYNTNQMFALKRIDIFHNVRCQNDYNVEMFWYSNDEINVIKLKIDNNDSESKKILTSSHPLCTLLVQRSCPGAIKGCTTVTFFFDCIGEYLYNACAAKRVFTENQFPDLAGDPRFFSWNAL